MATPKDYPGSENHSQTAFVQGNKINCWKWWMEKC